jgi:hypothetical protein
VMPGPDNDQRSIGRTHIQKGALLFFNGQPGVRACNVIDSTNPSAKIRTHVLPTTFNLTFAPESERNAPSLRGGVLALDLPQCRRARRYGTLFALCPLRLRPRRDPIR